MLTSCMVRLFTTKARRPRRTPW